MKNQLANITLRKDLMSEEDLTSQSATFLHAFVDAMKTGNLDDITRPEYQSITSMIEDISRSRAIQGYTPSETATYIFSLKDTILIFLQKEYGDRPTDQIFSLVNR